jgi:hypothetical protein
MPISLDPGRYGAYLLCALLLAWPALYNGFPLVFSDTGTYLAAAIEGWVPADRPIYYSLFVSALALPLSPYAVPIVQGFLAVVLLGASQTIMLGGVRPLWLAVTVGALALMTPLPWVASWLMPDVFGGMMVVAFITLAVYSERIAATQRFLLSIAVIFSAIVATGNVLLLSLLTGCFVTGQWLTGWRVGRGTLRTLSIVLMASYGLALLPNLAYYGRITLNPHSTVFLAARLFQGGVMLKYLEDRCPTQHDIPLCPYLDEVSKTDSNGFLWADNSLAQRTNARGKNRARYGGIVNDAIIHTFPAFFTQGLKDAWALMKATSLGEEERDINFRSLGWSRSPVTGRIHKHYPYVSPNFAHARQQQGTLGVESLNSFYRVVTYTSYAALLLLVWWWARRDVWELAVAGALVLLALPLNALVFGTLSGAFVRYQARLTWVAMFFVLIGVLHLVKSRAGWGRYK